MYPLLFRFLWAAHFSKQSGPLSHAGIVLVAIAVIVVEDAGPLAPRKAKLNKIPNPNSSVDGRTASTLTSALPVGFFMIVKTNSWEGAGLPESLTGAWMASTLTSALVSGFAL